MFKEQMKCLLIEQMELEQMAIEQIEIEQMQGTI